MVRNSKTVKAMNKGREEEEQEKLIEEIIADASLGRMSKPRKLSADDMESVLLTRRFGINQGFKSDGRDKWFDQCDSHIRAMTTPAVLD